MNNSIAQLVEGRVPRKREMDSLHRIPIRYSPDCILYPTKREKFLADAFLYSGNFEFCKREFEEAFKRDIDVKAIKKFMSSPRVKAYMTERLKDLGYANGYTKERYIRELIEYKEGQKALSPAAGFCMKLLGLALGFNESVTNNNMTAQVINFTQADGSQ